MVEIGFNVVQIQILWGEKTGKADFSMYPRVIFFFFSPKTNFPIRPRMKNSSFSCYSDWLIKLLKGNFNELETLFFWKSSISSMETVRRGGGS